MDAPKTLASEAERIARSALRSRPHVEALALFVDRMRQAKGASFQIPDFDPLDGGAAAEVLFLLEAPGPKAIKSGFISRNNPDETAKNFFLLSADAGIDRRSSITWNAVPWYIGSGIKIRTASLSDVRSADEWLAELLTLLRQLRIVVLVGKKALHAHRVVRDSRPGIEIMTMPHPSPMFINRAVSNRDVALKALRDVAMRLASSAA